MASLVIGPDAFVTLSYVLFDQHGEAVDRATSTDPLTYVHGYAQIVPGLEARLAGLEAGAQRSFTLEAEDAFGERDDEAVFEVERADFPQSDKVVTGDEFVAEGPDGEPISMRVVELLADAFVVDTNHPLAGQRVRFDVEVAAVRPATEDEIAEAQQELEDRADEHACCDHDHDHDHAHDHDHDGPEAAHDHVHERAKLVQISKKKS
jgi:FKBP-type peptidyl-prolyl cis-trans isomerase SlyD